MHGFKQAIEAALGELQCALAGVHNAVEVVGLAYLFVLLVNEHSYGHGIAVIALLLFLVRQFGVRVKSDPS